MNTEDYLKLVTEQIRCKKARNMVQEEVRRHIGDQHEAYIIEGMDRMEAEEAAVNEMGDPVEAGIALDRIHRPRMAVGSILLIALLSLAGFGIQLLLQSKIQDVTFLPGSDLLHFTYLLAGFSAMIGVCYLDYSRIGGKAKAVLAIFYGLLILGSILFGVELNGLRAWIRVGGITLSLRALLLLTVPVYGGVLYSLRGQGYAGLFQGILWTLPAFLTAFRTCGITTVMTLFFSFAVTLTVAVSNGWFRIARKRTLAAAWGSIVLVPVCYILFMLRNGAGYQIARLKAVLDPYGSEAGYQVRMIRDLISGGRWIGANRNMQPESLLVPEGGDLVLAYVIGCYGILAAALLTGGILFLLLRLLRASLKQKNQLGMIMGVGCTAVFLMQILFYAISNAGVVIFGGTYCPFLTYGGSGILVTYLLLGLLLSIYRYQNVVSDMPSAAVHSRLPRIRITIEK